MKVGIYKTIGRYGYTSASVIVKTTKKQVVTLKLKLKNIELRTDENISGEVIKLINKAIRKHRDLSI